MSFIPLALMGCFLIPPDFQGSYLLLSIDGEELPATFATRGDTIVETISGSLIAASDNTFVFSLEQQIRVQGSATGTEVVESGGFWSQSGNSVTLNAFSGGERYEADFDGSEVTFTAFGRSYRLSR